MKTITAERCNVCGRKWLAPLIKPCIHTPEEQARADVAQIMKRHGPALRRAFEAAFKRPPLTSEGEL